MTGKLAALQDPNMKVEVGKDGKPIAFISPPGTPGASPAPTQATNEAQQPQVSMRPAGVGSPQSRLWIWRCAFDSEHAGERGRSDNAYARPSLRVCMWLELRCLLMVCSSCRHGQPRPANVRKLGVRAPTTVSNVLCSILRLCT